MKATDVRTSPSATYVAVFANGETLTFYWLPSMGFATHNTNWARKYARRLDEKSRNPIDIFTAEEFDVASEVSTEPEQETVHTINFVEPEVNDATETAETVDQEVDAAGASEAFVDLVDGPDFPAEQPES